MRVRLAAVLVCTTASLPGTFVHASTAPPAFFDYLHIEANSGSSAGGHAAVRFGDLVYHFQHAEPGIIRPAVQPWSTFDLSYRGLGNRPIHAQRIAVSPATYDRLHERFQHRFVVDESHVEQLHAARRDRGLLACLAGSNPERRRVSTCRLTLPGAGYFYGAPPGATTFEGRSAVDTLRRRIDRMYDRAHLGRRLEELRTQIEGLQPIAAAADLPRAGLIAAPSRGIADAYVDLLLEYLALRALAGDGALAGDALRSTGDWLDAHARNVLAARAVQQTDRIVDLLGSARSDRGYPLLIGLARLVALHASIERGEWMVLDTYADDAPSMPSGELQPYGAVLGTLVLERRDEMETMRAAALAAPADDEAAWSRFEVAANVALELDEALAGKRARIRWHHPGFAPAKGASLRSEWPVPKLPDSVLGTALEQADDVEIRIAARLRELHRYDLLRRNCVTELFRTMHDQEDLKSGAAQGVEVGAKASFIPFVSAIAVRRAYPVVEEIDLPSYREMELRRLKERSPSWATSLREHTSLTSTVIPFNRAAEVFLFFSDSGIAWRPLAGAANVAFTAGAMLGGIATAPFDGGSLLTASARGLLYSLPELAFVNIRKGSIALLPRGWSGPDAPFRDTDP